MRISIHNETCIGCGICEEIAPELFEMGDYFANVKKDSIPSNDLELLEKILKVCPAGAITIHRED